jgi:beta-lactamase superfamily II metal-dependent hydrolase
VGLWWVAEVARVGGAAPLGRVGLVVIATVAALLAVGVAVGRRHRRVGVVIAAVAVAVLVGAPHVAGGARPEMVEVRGAELWRGSGGAAVLVVPGDARADGVLSGLRQHGVGRLDLVVLRSAGPQAAGTLAVLSERVDVDRVWAPQGSPAPDAGEPPPGPVAAGGLEVRARPSGDRLEVDVALVGDGRPAGRRVGGAG